MDANLAVLHEGTLAIADFKKAKWVRISDSEKKQIMLCRFVTHCGTGIGHLKLYVCRFFFSCFWYLLSAHQILLGHRLGYQHTVAQHHCGFNPFHFTQLVYTTIYSFPQGPLSPVDAALPGLSSPLNTVTFTDKSENLPICLLGSKSCFCNPPAII